MNSVNTIGGLLAKYPGDDLKMEGKWRTPLANYPGDDGDLEMGRKWGTPSKVPYTGELR
jgi:hypothetical protein